MRLFRCLCLLVSCAALPLAGDEPNPAPAPVQQDPSPAPPSIKLDVAQPSAPGDHKPDAAPWAGTLAPASADQPKDPHWTLEAYRQDAETLIWEFAKRAHLTVTMLDRAPTLVDVYFTNFDTEKAFRAILRAADLDYVKNEDGYYVGLPIDLKLRFPKPDDKVVEATYRCRRIAASTMVETMKGIFPDAEFKVATGPEFLTPAVESVGGVNSDSGIKTLSATDKNFHTHDVVFSGSPDLVNRALTLARKFDAPRAQVRVNIRVVQMTQNAARNLGVSWMQSLNLAATEMANPSVPSTTPAGASGAVPQGTGLTVGKFTHSVVSLNATLNAMEQSGESKTLANPTLLVLDGEKSFILSGTKYMLPTIDSRDPSGQAIYKTIETKLGLYLQVGVQVGLDDDMVLSIYPQVTNLTGFTTVNQIDYPIINTIEEQATVRAVKGDVIVLGGIKREITTDQKNGVPFLSRLPLLGNLFKSDDKTKTTEDLMFFLTPEIVEDKEAPLDIKLSYTEGPGKPAW